MAQMDVAGRLRLLRERLVEEDVDAMVLTRSITVEYMTGFDGLRDAEDPHVALVTADRAVVVTDTRYLEVARVQADQTGLWEVVDCGTHQMPHEVGAVLDLSAYASIALEDTLAYSLYTDLAATLPDGARVVAARNWVEKLRQIKDSGELERIAAAQAVTDAAFSHICGFIKAGMTEAEIAVELEYSMRRLGADGLAFPSIVATGANAALPHAVPSQRRVEAGDLLVLDFGAAKGGYCSDMTRTVAVGAEPSDEARRAYETVLAAQLADLALIADGVSGVAADAAGREVIKAAGFGEYFGHGTSHGVGLEIHEAPSASPRSKDTLQAGEVISCEPGIYLPGTFGVRIEDLVAVTEGGAHIFTQSPKELLVV